ncbi:MAG: hypothetical protein ACOYOV_13860 [Bacteroidales bacterium]
MTAQAYETLIINGEIYKMAYEPLKSYLNQLKIKPDFVAPHTALWRGYIGKWELKDDKLYLIEFNGIIEGSVNVNINYIFPGQASVFADWFTGEIRIPQGELLDYVHGGYQSVYEKDLFLNFNNGELTGSRTVKNEPKDYIGNNEPEDDLPF